jgi:uncharacterized Zn-binding protein involved in type VI secretion
MLRAVICKGDATSHGGKVLEGKETARAGGRPIALKGHMTFCPQCKGNFPIIEGLGFHSFAGVGTVVEGMRTACGATLIASQQGMRIDDRSESQAASTAAAGVAAKTAASKAAFKGAFRALDRNGKPVQGEHYRIELADGSSVRGATDAEGYTAPVDGQDPASLKLFWEHAEDLA